MNPNVARQFIETLYQPDDLIEVRIIGGPKAPFRNWYRAKHLSESVISELGKTHEGRNFYLGANPRRGRGGTANDVEAANSLFVDWDGIDAHEAKRRITAAGLPEPSLLANSGHGVHAYWLLSFRVPGLSLWTRQQKALILAVDSDPSIHDPPRIMRWIGFPNCKDSEPCVTSIIQSDTNARYDLDLFPAPLVEPARQHTRQTFAGEGRGPLRTVTTGFLAVGCDSGERNARSFAAAVELFGAGYTDSEVADLLHTAGRRCRPAMDATEIEAVIASARSKPRTQWVDDDDDFGNWGPGMPSTENRSDTGTTSTQVATSPALDVTTIKRDDEKPHLSNVMQSIKVGDDGEKKTITFGKSIDRVLKELSESTGGWPRKVSGIVFIQNDIPVGRLPGGNALRLFNKPDDLFAWMHEQTILHWASVKGKGATNHKTKAPVSVVSKPEFFAYVEQCCKPEYAGVEYLPHWPEVEGLYYTPCNLPAANGDCLNELLERVNAESDIDRALLLAALATPGWGGPCGARPAFVLSSAHGRGVGKTSTVERFAQVWGGCITISSETEKWEGAKSRLLSDAALPIRCVLIDNMRKKVASADLESMLTAPIIDGHRMYHGQFSRPNRLTYFITANTPRMSQDLADRAVLIRIGQQKHESDWASWIERFMTDNRPQLVSDLIGFLKTEPQCRIASANRDRWGPWQDGILSLFEQGNEMAAESKARRPLVDSDAEDAADFRSEMEAELRERGHDPVTEQVKIPRQVMAEIIERRGLFDKKFSTKAVTTMLQELATTAVLRKVLCHHRFDSVRCWVWVGTQSGTFEPYKTCKTINARMG